MNVSIANIAHKYLQKTNYSIDNKTFELQLLTHPEYPSFKSISDTFDYFGIENLVAHVPNDVLDKLPIRFLTTLITESGFKIFLVIKNKNNIQIINEKFENKKISYEKFMERWQGNIIVVEEIIQRRSDYTRIENIGLLLFVVIFAITLIINSGFNITLLMYSLLCLLGLGFTYYIVQEDFGFYNEVVGKVCEVVSKKDGCKGVIKDENSKLFSFLSLSDLTLIYFVSITFTIQFLGYNNTILLCISIFTITIVIYSIYYQAIKLKQWCALCIGISSILVLQLIVLYFDFSFFDINLGYLLKIVFLGFSTSITWFSFKKLFIKSTKLETIEIDFLKFKRDKELFDVLLKKEKLKERNVSLGNNKITFGAENPKLVIDAVTNPLCGFCVESFLTYCELLEKYDYIQLNVIFSSFTTDINNPAVKIIMTVLDQYFNKGKENALNALKEWFKIKDYEKWLKKYRRVNEDESSFIKILSTHQSWINANGINYTPATIVNNYYYPKSYAIKDLFLFVDDIILEKEKLIFEPI